MNWEYKSLNDICEIKLGKTPSRTDSSLWDEKKVSANVWLSIADLTSCDGLFISDSKEYVSDKGAALFGAVEAGTLLMSFKLTIGKLAFAQKKLRTNEAIVALPLKENVPVDQFFLYYYLLSYDWDRESENDIKLKGKTLNKTKLKRIKVPVPPISTQKAIVQKLDEIFSEIDTAVQLASENSSYSQTLWQSFINSVVRDFSINGELVRLGDVVAIVSKLVDPKESTYQNMVHVGAGNILSRSDELIELKTAKEEGLISGKFLFDMDAVLYSKIRPYLRKVARPSFAGLCSADVYPLIPKRDSVNRDFLFYLLLTDDFTEYAISGSERAGMPKVNRDHLFYYQFKLPSVEAQFSITEYLKTASVRVKNLQRTTEKRIKELSELRKSILKQAFASELVKD